MKTVLITGMSGTGKSTTITHLSSLGYKAFDLDSEAYSHWIDAEPDPTHPDNEVKPGKDWVWHKEQALELLSRQDTEVMFVSGCASNMGDFYQHFTHVVLLTAADTVILDRLSRREGNAYGTTPEEAERVLSLKRTIEPLLRSDADLEIDTGVSEEATASLILQYIGIENGH